MGVKVIHFLSLFFIALALGGSLAHLFELPNKINLSREDYLTVQQIYRGWALLGIAVVGAFISALVQAFMVRKQRHVLVWTLVALACIVGTQAVFWIFTYPANQQTHNWTALPPNWQELRQQWEYSHAAGAGLNLLALGALIQSILAERS